MNQKEWHILEYSDYQNSYPSFTLNEFQAKTSCTSVEKSSEFFTEEIESVLTQKYEFEYGEQTKLLAYLICLHSRIFFGREQNE